MATQTQATINDDNWNANTNVGRPNVRGDHFLVVSVCSFFFLADCVRPSRPCARIIQFDRISIIIYVWRWPDMWMSMYNKHAACCRLYSSGAKCKHVHAKSRARTHTHTFNGIWPLLKGTSHLYYISSSIYLYVRLERVYTFASQLYRRYTSYLFVYTYITHQPSHRIPSIGTPSSYIVYTSWHFKQAIGQAGERASARTHSTYNSFFFCLLRN